jgi:dGTP triphosphohydrolase
VTISINQSPDLVGEITPLLNAMRSALEAQTQAEAKATREGVAAVKVDVEAQAQAVRADIATVKADVDDLTTVNGAISTEVQAINTHTTSAATEIKQAMSTSEGRIKSTVNAKSLSAIRKIHRVTVSKYTTEVTIPAVNVNKTVINVASVGAAAGKNGAYGLVTAERVVTLKSSTKLAITNSLPIDIAIEVIEYA